jgi:hypothetical protein
MYCDEIHVLRKSVYRNAIKRCGRVGVLGREEGSQEAKQWEAVGRDQRSIREEEEGEVGR